MSRINFDDIIINGRPVAPIGIVFRDTPRPPSAPRPRISGVVTTSAPMACTLPEWEVFSAALRDAAPHPAPTFDVIVNHRKRIAPRLVVRLRPRGRRCRSFLRERFDRWAETFHGCSLQVTP